ncbi:MAG TPA: preprotein translocase subunit SecG [Spirochaetia bacterium]|nr:MAG: preprotein translocase subunit SecG [Spirochaetes bacterium GWB1_36_13]HCL55745.1 preprotein translocase subunit SecG [Spirochaetia bacterium]
MEIIQTILYILIIISAVLLILLVLAQSNKGSDIGLFSGSTDMVFGSQKGNVLTKTTGILATILIAGTFFLGVLRAYDTKDRVKLEKTEEIKQEGKTLEELNTKTEETKTPSTTQIKEEQKTQ